MNAFRARGLDRILRMATPRGRVSIALMSFSGLRTESLSNYHGRFIEGGFSTKTPQTPNSGKPIQV